jgi:hypothetical protein
MRGLAFLASRLALLRVEAESVMPAVMFAHEDAKLPATRLPCAPPNRTRSALSVSQVLRCAAVAASNRMPLTRWPADEPRPDGADSDGIALKASMVSSRMSSLPQSDRSGFASANRSTEDFCSSALFILMALRAQSIQRRKP